MTSSVSRNENCHRQTASAQHAGCTGHLRSQGHDRDHDHEHGLRSRSDDKVQKTQKATTESVKDTTKSDERRRFQTESVRDQYQGGDTQGVGGRPSFARPSAPALPPISPGSQLDDPFQPFDPIGPLPIKNGSHGSLPPPVTTTPRAPQPPVTSTPPPGTLPKKPSPIKTPPFVSLPPPVSAPPPSSGKPPPTASKPPPVPEPSPSAGASRPVLKLPKLPQPSQSPELPER
jgi:hypothetical protein